MCENYPWLPDLYPFDWSAVESEIEVLEELFRCQISQGRIIFDGLRVSHYPNLEDNGKLAIFWHVITKDEVGKSGKRDLDPNRCERLAWIEAVLRNPDKILVWSDSERPDRVTVALPDFSYQVILHKKKGTLYLITAYPVLKPHQQAKLRKSWESSQTGS